MDRHRPSKDKHGKTMNGDRARESTRTLKINESQQDYEKDQPMPNADRICGKDPRAALTGQLSGSSDYVRKWLVQTDEEANQRDLDSGIARQQTPSEYTSLERRVRITTADACFHSSTRFCKAQGTR